MNSGAPSTSARAIVSSTGSWDPSRRIAVSSNRSPSSADSPVRATLARPASWPGLSSSGTISSDSRCPCASARSYPNMRSAAALKSTTLP